MSEDYTFTADCYAAGHQATTDLQAIENNCLALRGAFSGTTAPSNIVRGMAWLDRTLSLLKTRNNAEDAWNIVLTAVASGLVAGDIPYASATNVLSLLAKGTAYQSLNMNSGATAPQWQASLQSLLTAQGDMIVASAANTPARLAVGTAGQVMIMNAGATAPEWVNTTTTANTERSFTTTTFLGTSALKVFTPKTSGGFGVFATGKASRGGTSMDLATSLTSVSLVNPLTTGYLVYTANIYCEAADTISVVVSNNNMDSVSTTMYVKNVRCGGIGIVTTTD